MRERLVSYLLGDLPDDEARVLEEEVEANPQLRHQLERLRDCLMAADNVCGGETVGEEEMGAEAPRVPRGLADRTADSVHDLVLGLEAVDADGSSSGWRGFSLVDGGVTVGVVLALGMMLLPALCESREASRRIACQANLADLYKSLRLYANAHHGLYPFVQPGENAGVYAVRLADGRFIDRRQLAEKLVCPSSELADDVAAGKTQVVIPRQSELRRLGAATLSAVRRVMGGSYAYRLGYLDGPLYRPVATGQRSRSPLLSDAPHPTDCGRWQSLNHSGRGQNVLFDNGAVSYQVNCLLPSVDDNFFLNASGEAAAGRHWDDAVLVRSEVTPGVIPFEVSSPRPPTAVWRVKGVFKLRAKMQ
ncbi:MAG: hypothetical protein AAGJ46_05915 [Planctomycetota bacterium]